MSDNGAGEGFLRPEPEILSESSLVPDENLVRPAPGRFTHEVVGDTPFSWGGGDGPPDGELASGTPVLLVSEEAGGRCWVVDGRGLRVSVPCARLRPHRL